jgi:hypothetical protein
MTEVIFDVSNDADFKIITNPTTGVVTSGKYIHSSGYIFKDYTSDPLKPGQGLASGLADKFHKKTNNKYAGYITVFAFNELARTTGTMGRVQDIGIKNVVLYRNRDNATLNHELLHGLGLHHTHRDGTPIKDAVRKYVYPNSGTNHAASTDNVMSYRTIAITTWKWQWDIFKPNI